MVEDCQPQQTERQQAERPTGDADNPLFICAHFIRSRTDGSRPADDRSDPDFVTPAIPPYPLIMTRADVLHLGV